MAFQSQLILIGAGNVPGLGHLLAVLAHGQAGARLTIARQFRLEVMGPQLQQGLELVAGTLGAVGLQQDLAQAFVDPDRRIRSGIHPAGDAAVDLPQGDLVGHQQRRFQARAAGLLDIVGRGGGRKPRAEDAFAGQVEVPGMLEHGTGGHLAKAQAVQVVALDQALQGGGEHRLVAGGGIGAVGTGEGDAVAADNRDATQLCHGKLPIL